MVAPPCLAKQGARLRTIAFRHTAMRMGHVLAILTAHLPRAAGFVLGDETRQRGQ